MTPPENSVNRKLNAINGTCLQIKRNTKSSPKAALRILLTKKTIIRHCIPL
jgi:hypothetical protein